MECPPYEVSVSGYGSFKLPIHIHFSNKEVATFKPFLQLFDGCDVSTVLSKVFTFRKPNKDFRERLLLAGGCQCLSPPVIKGEEGENSRKRVLTKSNSSQQVSKRRKKAPPKSTAKGKGKKKAIIISSEDDSTDSEDIYTRGSSSD